MLRKYYLELLLILAVVLLVGQLAWPAATRWWHRPKAGKIGIDAFDPRGPLATKYAIYLPAEYEDSENLWPLIVFLHGSGERGNDPLPLHGSSIFSLARDGTAVPAIIAVPQCLPEHSWQSESVTAIIEHLASTYRVDGQRIYLGGYSMGGHGTWATAQSKPVMFAAIVPISGGGDPNRAASLADVPIWAFHGVRDNVIPVAATQQMVDAVQAAGGQPRLTLLPEGDHGICDEVCRRKDLWEWLLQQNRSKANSPSAKVGETTDPDS